MTLGLMPTEVVLRCLCVRAGGGRPLRGALSLDLVRLMNRYGNYLSH